jgi:hypothetical protein
MMSVITKPAFLQPAIETSCGLFDWFDPIELGIRDRVLKRGKTPLLTTDQARVPPRQHRHLDRRRPGGLVVCGFLGSTPVVSTNGVNKLYPATGSPNSWISCCRGKRRSWWQRCCDQPLCVRVQEHSANTELSDSLEQRSVCRLFAQLGRASRRTATEGLKG